MGSNRGVIPVTNLSGITVLVVDDNEDNVDVLATFLRTSGATIVTAASGLEALTRLDAERHIDLLLTDLAMPGLSGIEPHHASSGNSEALGRDHAFGSPAASQRASGAEARGGDSRASAPSKSFIVLS